MVEEVVKYIIIITILFFVFDLFIKIFDSIKKFVLEIYNTCVINYKIKKYIKEKIAEQENNIPLRYYGLFEFLFDNCKDEQRLKRECSWIVKEKIKSKYKYVNTSLSDDNKIFFSSTNFLKIDSVIDDFVEFYNNFSEISKKKNIKTYLKFCLWTKAGNITAKQAK